MHMHCCAEGLALQCLQYYVNDANTRGHSKLCKILKCVNLWYMSASKQDRQTDMIHMHVWNAQTRPNTGSLSKTDDTSALMTLVP